MKRWAPDQSPQTHWVAAQSHGTLKSVWSPVGRKKWLVFNLGAAFFPGLTLHLCYCYLLPNKNPLLTKSGTIKYVPGFWRLWPQRSALYPVLSSPPASSESGCTTCTQRETQREVGISSLPPPPVSFLICTHRWIIHTRKQTVYSLNRHNK